ncbi:hypothetical protein ACIBK9_47265 [Nonomuraea sp. NPDC050227]|uniref:hypothetical protein n=1 Tax=Nonomuraea sp. NPDC050227 TaxID=3364360 RepID=UPI0037994580
MATISAAQLSLLRRSHEGTVYVDRDPGSSRPGSGIHRRTLDALRNAGLLRKGDYVPLKGRPLVVTTKGVALLIHLGQTPAPEEG